jgi:hypothetical protein
MTEVQGPSSGITLEGKSGPTLGRGGILLNNIIFIVFFFLLSCQLIIGCCKMRIFLPIFIEGIH